MTVEQTDAARGLTERRGLLTGRVAVVTGAASGIGRATALLFAREGAEILALDQDGDSNDETSAMIRALGGKSEAITVDLADVSAITTMARRLIRTHAQVDILFNNAGNVEFRSLRDADSMHWQRMIDINLRAPFILIQSLLPALIQSKHGAIINNSSVDGIYGHPRAAVYSIAKAGVNIMTQALCDELAELGVRINAMAPGGIGTRMVSQIPQSERDKMAGSTPLRRLGTAEEAAALALFLASDASSYMTGEVVKLDGGRNALTSGVL